LDFFTRGGKFRRLMLAILCSSFSDMPLYISRDAPLRLALGLSPRFAASAAPAAFCWAFDLAGMVSSTSFVICANAYAPKKFRRFAKWGRLAHGKGTFAVIRRFAAIF
jgi:hypothetical protein